MLTADRITKESYQKANEPSTLPSLRFFQAKTQTEFAEAIKRGTDILGALKNAAPEETNMRREDGSLGSYMSGLETGFNLGYNARMDDEKLPKN